MALKPINYRKYPDYSPDYGWDRPDRKDPHSIKEVVYGPMAKEYQNKPVELPAGGMETGYPFLDRLFNFWTKGGMLVVATDSEISSSPLATNWLTGLTLFQDITVGFVSFHLTQESFSDRMALNCMAFLQKNGAGDKHPQVAYLRGLDQLRRNSICLHKPNKGDMAILMDDICRQVESWVEQLRIKALVIDGVENIREKKARVDGDDLAVVIPKLKEQSEKWHIPVLATSNANQGKDISCYLALDDYFANLPTVLQNVPDAVGFLCHKRSDVKLPPEQVNLGYRYFYGLGLWATTSFLGLDYVFSDMLGDFVELGIDVGKMKP